MYIVWHENIEFSEAWATHMTSEFINDKGRVGMSVWKAESFMGLLGALFMRTRSFRSKILENAGLRAREK